MSDAADRFRRIAGTFTERVEGAAPEAWDLPSPCEGWVARDVVRHLVEWVPPFLHAGSGIHLAAAPSVDDDPAAGWAALRDALQEILDDPGVSEHRFEHPRAGAHPLDVAIDMFITSDVFMHTWDLARATGQDDVLDPGEVHTLLVGMEPIGDTLAESGQYGPRIPVDDDADEQTRLLALIGRRA